MLAFFFTSENILRLGGTDGRTWKGRSGKKANVWHLSRSSTFL